jgi:hypothetical protein
LSFLLDVISLALIGFFTVNAQRIIVVLQGDIWKRGRSKRFIWIIGSAVTATFVTVSTLLYLDVIPFFTIKGSDWMLNSGLPLNLQRSPTVDAIAVLIFLSYPGWFQLGVLSADYTFRRVPGILTAVVNASFPRGGAIPFGAEDVDAAYASTVLVNGMLPSYQEAFKVLLVVVDSPIFVFAITQEMKHFTELTKDQQVSYLRALQTTPVLSAVGHLLKTLASFGYYVQEKVAAEIGYDGSFLRRSYVQ